GRGRHGHRRPQGALEPGRQQPRRFHHGQRGAGFPGRGAPARRHRGLHLHRHGQHGDHRPAGTRGRDERDRRHGRVPVHRPAAARVRSGRAGPPHRRLRLHGRRRAQRAAPRRVREGRQAPTARGTEAAAQVSPVQAAHEEEALGKAYDSRLMRRLLRYLRPYRDRVALAVLVLLAGAALQLVGPWITKLVLDHAIPARDHRLLAVLAGAYTASLLLAFALEYVQTLLTTSIGQLVMYDLRREIFGHLQRLELPFFDRNPVGRLMTRVTNDVETLNELFSSGVVTVFGDVFTLALIMGAMFVLDWRLALVVLAVLPLVALTAFAFRARIRDAYREIRLRLARLNAFLQERISGITVVQLFGRERRTADAFRAIDRDYLDAHLRSITYYALFF